jgi:hypothetical protein
VLLELLSGERCEAESAGDTELATPGATPPLVPARGDIADFKSLLGVLGDPGFGLLSVILSLFLFLSEKLSRFLGPGA